MAIVSIVRMIVAVRNRGRVRKASNTAPGSKKMPVRVAGVDICGPVGSGVPAYGGGGGGG